MQLPPIVFCCNEIQNGLPFWCRLTQVVLEKRPLNRCVCVYSTGKHYNTLLWAQSSPVRDLLFGSFQFFLHTYYPRICRVTAVMKAIVVDLALRTTPAFQSAERAGSRVCRQNSFICSSSEIVWFCVSQTVCLFEGTSGAAANYSHLNQWRSSGSGRTQQGSFVVDRSLSTWEHCEWPPCRRGTTALECSPGTSRHRWRRRRRRSSELCVSSDSSRRR